MFKNFFKKFFSKELLGARTATPYYFLTLAHGVFGPADSLTYYFGAAYAALPTNSGSTYYRMYIPKAGTIKEISVTMVNAGAFATTEDSTMALRLNDTIDYTISSAVKHNANGGSYTVAGLGIRVAKGDYVVMKWTTPAWVTNPTNVSHNVQLLIEG